MEFQNIISAPELFYNVLFNADYDSVINYCLTHKEAILICRDPYFWQQKALYNFGISKEEFNNTILPADQRYLQLLTEKGGIAKGSEKFLNLAKFMRRAIQANREDLVVLAVSLGFQNWLIPLEEYAIKGDQEKVDHYLKLSKSPYNYQKAAEGALKGGHKNLFNHIRMLAYINYNWEISDLTKAAAQSGNIEIFDFMLSLLRPYSWTNIEQTAGVALENGHKDLFDHIISIVPSDYSLDWNYLAASAGKFSNELFDYVISIASVGYNWDWVFLANVASEDNNINFLRHIVGSAPRGYDFEWNYLIQPPIQNGNKELFNEVQSLAPANWNWDWDFLAGEALLNGNKEMFDWIRSIAPPYWPWNWNFLRNQAGEAQNEDIINYINSITQ